VPSILIASSIANLCYPFIALYVWWKISKTQAARKIHEIEREQRINGRMDELIAAKERIAHEEGRRVGMAEGILIGQRGT
jgi:hypothetical protein